MLEPAKVATMPVYLHRFSRSVRSLFKQTAAKSDFLPTDFRSDADGQRPAAIHLVGFRLYPPPR